MLIEVMLRVLNGLLVQVQTLHHKQYEGLIKIVISVLNQLPF